MHCVDIIGLILAIAICMYDVGLNSLDEWMKQANYHYVIKWVVAKINLFVQSYIYKNFSFGLSGCPNSAIKYNYS